VIVWNPASNLKKIDYKEAIVSLKKKEPPHSPFVAEVAVSGCTCTGCIYLKAWVIYKMECNNCVHPFKSNHKRLSIHQDTVSC
jgi:hypothetical protein